MMLLERKKKRNVNFNYNKLKEITLLKYASLKCFLFFLILEKRNEPTHFFGM